MNDGKLKILGQQDTATLFCFHYFVKFLAIFEERRKGNVLFNHAVSTFYLQLYVVGHMIKDHTDNDRQNHMPSLPGASKSALDLPRANVGVPYTDFKYLISQYIFSTWQDDWNGAVMNKLHSVKPVLGDWQSSYRWCRKDEVVLCRARIGHTHLTHSYILRKDILFIAQLFTLFYNIFQFLMIQPSHAFTFF